MSDILMRADLIGRAEFYWVGEKRDLYWGNQHYRVSLVKGTSITTVRKVESKRVPYHEPEENWLHINKYVSIPSGKIEMVRITNRTFSPGQIICVEKNTVRQNLTITDSCFLVDENIEIHIPFVYPGRTPLKLK